MPAIPSPRFPHNSSPNIHPKGHDGAFEKKKDELVKSLKVLISVIPAKAGIQ